MSRLTKLPVADVIVGDRHRKDLGDIDELAQSILKVQLLHPIVSDYLRIVAESDENTCRKAFSPSEAVAVGAEIERLEKPRAEANRAANLPNAQVSHLDKVGRTTHIVGPAVGMSARTYEKAKAVVAATSDPDPEVAEVARDAVEEMDRTGKISGAYRKVKLAEVMPAAEKRPTAERVAQIRDLGTKGHTRDQIAKELNITVDRVHWLCREHAITLPADAMGRQKKHDANRIVETAVTTLEGIAGTLSLIDFEALNPENIREWHDSLGESLSSLQSLRNRLKKELG
jgi:ParB-like chromosome segregation protein Spo0J